MCTKSLISKRMHHERVALSTVLYALIKRQRGSVYERHLLRTPTSAHMYAMRSLHRNPYLYADRAS